MVGIGVGGGSRGAVRRRLGGVAGGSTTGVWCVCVWCLLELIAKAMTPHPSGSGRCIGYEWARH